MGRWQREYERGWRDYTRQTIADCFGKSALQCYSSILQADEHQVRQVLAAEGITHVPPNHSRWHAPIPASLLTASDAHDSIMSEDSYVYSTPPPPASLSFTWQEFGSQSTPGRRVSASQRLQRRMADLSPISDNRRTSIECLRTNSPTSEAAKSSWTPQQGSPKLVGKTRRTPRRSLESSFRGDDLDDSIQSVHLCADEGSRTKDERMPESYDEDEKAAVAQRGDCGEDAARDQVITSEEVAANEQDTIQCEAEDMNVSKELIFGSDSEDEEQRKKQTDGAALVEKEQVNTDTSLSGKFLHGLQPPENLSQRPAWASEPEFECFETENGYDSENQQPPKGEQDVEVLEPARGAPCFPGAIQTIEEQNVSNFAKQQDISAESTAASVKSTSVARQKQPVTTRQSTFSLPAFPSSRKRTSYGCPPASSARLSSDKTRTFPSSTASCTRLTAIVLPTTPQNVSHASPSATQAPPIAPASSKSALSQKRANRGALLRTKLPLQMEYRFASDQRRRHRRRESLAVKPSVFPYVVPELLVELQPCQMKALKWMLEREEGPGDRITIDQQRCGEAKAVDALVVTVCGGVLTDEMGLDKTVCCLALICESLRQVRAADAEARSEAGVTVPRLTPPTLIVTPLSFLSQWKQEIRAKTNLSVVTYQGVTRKSFCSATQFMGADIVLSTYDTLRLLECKVQDRNRDQDGDEDNCAEDGWHQAPRLTPRSKKSVVTSKLHQLQWFRVILDESHLIANAGCGRARAAFTLSSKRRWCVTETPMQNHTADLAALLQFVGLGNSVHTLSERELGVLVHRVVMR